MGVTYCFAIAVFIMNIDFWRAQAVIKGTNLLSLRITLHINILAAHILFILAFSMTSYIISHSSRKEGININYKRIGATNLYDSLPFFLYCLFIFSSNLMITFTSVNGEYEIGASWGVITALIPMMLAGGLAGMYIKRVENQYNSTNKREFTVSNLKTFSVLNICLVIFSTILSCITMSVMMNILLRNSIILGPHYTSETYLIFTLVSCGYTFIASGLFNIAVLMYLNQSKYLVRLTSVSLGINTLGTFIISGFLVYPYIVLGLFISSIMFYLLSYYYCIKILDN